MRGVGYRVGRGFGDEIYIYIGNEVCEGVELEVGG